MVECEAENGNLEYSKRVNNVKCIPYTDIDECATFPCLNGGTCTDGVNTYTCSCATGYEGENCAVSK